MRKGVYKATTHEITMNPQDSSQYSSHLDQIATTHINTSTKDPFFMTPINISAKKNSNHIKIRLAAKKKKQQQKLNKQEKSGWNCRNGRLKIPNQNPNQ